jgi:hypothetical protein
MGANKLRSFLHAAHAEQAAIAAKQITAIVLRQAVLIVQ